MNTSKSDYEYDSIIPIEQDSVPSKSTELSEDSTNSQTQQTQQVDAKTVQNNFTDLFSESPDVASAVLLAQFDPEMNKFLSGLLVNRIQSSDELAREAQVDYVNHLKQMKEPHKKGFSEAITDISGLLFAGTFDLSGKNKKRDDLSELQIKLLGLEMRLLMGRINFLKGSIQMS